MRPAVCRLLSLPALICTVLAGQGGASDDADAELSLISRRRIANFAQIPDPSWISNMEDWLNMQNNDGSWDDVSYLAGCPVQRTNWPTQRHWNRLITFAAAWSGANPSISRQWAQEDSLLEAISNGLNYWFENDYEPADCMGNGGQPDKGCPCGTPGMWSTNWYDQAILIPKLCSTTCLLLKGANISQKLQDGCKRIPGRAYDLRDSEYGTGGYLAGVNYGIIYRQRHYSSRCLFESYFSDNETEDGIHRDGTYLQNSGILYNGHYGKDLLNEFIQLHAETIGTKFAAGNATREAIAAHIKGNEWMIYADSETKRLHWDLNAIGRFIAFPTADLQASADTNFNISKLATATADFIGAFDVRDTIHRLDSNGTEKLIGNKGFWDSDYMVHRRERFIFTNKMLSTRSSNSESINGINPYGYNLGQGTLFCYMEGNEYKDIMASWDWNLIPGTTTVLRRTKLSASNVRQTGKKDFVGVVSDGVVGTAVEDYVDPLDGTLSSQKAWFFLDDSVLVTTANLKSNASSKLSPVITVLDNRAAASDSTALIDGEMVGLENKRGSPIEGETLHYEETGYRSFDYPFTLTLFHGRRPGNWSTISTSPLGATAASIFSAYTTMPNATFSYAVFPGSVAERLTRERKSPTSKPVSGDGITGAAGSGRLSLVFWPGGDKSITIDLSEMKWAKTGSVTITSDQPAVFLFDTLCKFPPICTESKMVITLSDPTQKAVSASFAMKFDRGNMKVKKINGTKKLSKDFPRGPAEVKFTVDLPRGGLAGSSVSREIYVDWRG